MSSTISDLLVASLARADIIICQQPEYIHALAIATRRELDLAIPALKATNALSIAAGSEFTFTATTNENLDQAREELLESVLKNTGASALIDKLLSTGDLTCPATVLPTRKELSAAQATVSARRAVETYFTAVDDFVRRYDSALTYIASGAADVAAYSLVNSAIDSQSEALVAYLAKYGLGDLGSLLIGILKDVPDLVAHPDTDKAQEVVGTAVTGAVGIIAPWAGVVFGAFLALGQDVSGPGAASSPGTSWIEAARQRRAAIDSRIAAGMPRPAYYSCFEDGRLLRIAAGMPVPTECLAYLPRVS